MTVSASPVTAILLAGGRGTRLASVVRDLPKPLIPVAGKPFLFWVALSFAQYGVKEVIVSAGHLGEKIEAWISEYEADAHAPLHFRVVREHEPLGTGGGAIKALAFAHDRVLVANADTLLSADLSGAFTLMDDTAVDGVIVAVHQDDASRYGTLQTDAQNNLIGFQEKKPGSGLVSAGIYLFRKAALDVFPRDTTLSMEHDVFPTLIAKPSRIKVFRMDQAPMLDIGLPETLQQADGFLKRHFAEKFRKYLSVA